LALVEEDIHDCSACSVGYIACAFYWGFAVVFGVTTEFSLIDFALRVSAEGNTQMFKCVDLVGCFFS
jgi:hypothetical protein